MKVHTKKLLVLALIARRKKKKENARRRFWVYSLVQQRNLKGFYTTLYCDLRKDEQKFFNYFRMRVKTFDKGSFHI